MENNVLTLYNLTIGAFFVVFCCMSSEVLEIAGSFIVLVVNCILDQYFKLALYCFL